MNAENMHEELLERVQGELEEELPKNFDIANWITRTSAAWKKNGRRNIVHFGVIISIFYPIKIKKNILKRKFSTLNLWGSQSKVFIKKEKKNFFL